MLNDDWEICLTLLQKLNWNDVNGVFNMQLEADGVASLVYYTE